MDINTWKVLLKGLWESQIYLEYKSFHFLSHSIRRKTTSKDELAILSQKVGSSVSCYRNLCNALASFNIVCVWMNKTWKQ